MKTLLGLILILLITNCTSYKAVVDTAGRSGTFPHSKAEDITNDIILCEKFAEKTLSENV